MLPLPEVLTPDAPLEAPEAVKTFFLNCVLNAPI